MKDVRFEELKGKTLARIENNGDEVVFTTEAGETYRLYHDQECSESVTVEDVCGGLNDLIGSPLIEAEEVTSSENPEDVTKNNSTDSFTWTFYKLRTAGGSVVIRWYGESNGCYSESVSFERVGEDK